MKQYNVLFLSIGRRVELVNLFRNAANKMNLKSNLIGLDCNQLAPALYFVDKYYISPKITDSVYIEYIIEISLKENIALIVPTIDTELLLLSLNKEKIERESHAKLLISSQSVIEICRNKINTQHFLEKNNFKIPKMYNTDNIDEKVLNFPLFIKPEDGSSSINAFKVNNIDELKTYLKLISSPILQDFMDGEEYTVDIFLDFNSQIVTIVPRKRLAVRAGEISKGVICKNQVIIDEIKKLMQILKPIGHITVQLMMTSKGIEFIEINPRFGGGAPMSIIAGADSCRNLYKLLQNETLHYNEDYKDGLIFLRYDSCVCLNPEFEVIHD